MITRREMVAGMATLPLLRTGPVDAATATPAISRLDPALDKLIAPDASVTVLARGFRWAEGPVWSAKGNFLLFSDPPANIIHRWSRAQGISQFLKPSGLQTPVPPEIREAGANGLAFDDQDRLVVADSGSRAIVRIDLSSGKRTTLADRFEGKRFNSPNDLVMARSGAIYFTDPPYGLADGDTSPLRELDFCGLYRLAPDGSVALLDRHHRPNGVALSANESILYLALSDEKQPEVLAYALDPKGMPTSRSLFRDMRPQKAAGGSGLPDGIKAGPTGHIFATGPGGVHICTAQGELLGIVSTGKTIANCCLGEDGKALFMTSSDMLAVLPLS
ncbi:gluconolactonase [Sphingobium sp. SCG-1]|uniref:SMP-30/gluconolactonase/LRE family protein n=1 Tax=Sphingobium sp. SCG-1 TaxID=2072936 RepID=UPI000CD69FCB|nr:SMP-30/gluconolactonase/LRE family protein [Sphingobium sp. SCG-1]AUW59628.1 gluconolactonase [Sphingobium sp. SCG-1]